MKLATPKGFRDFLPLDAMRRKVVLDKIITVFERFGFDPLETPTLEFKETLFGKYGDEGDKLMYSFQTSGGDEVALRYDQTVPLARVVAQYGPRGAQKIMFPFKRYQIQSAFRGENTQKGRYREFLQCDADIVGVSTPLADAEILALVYAVYKDLGLDVIIKVNDRALITDIEPKHLAAIDKLAKIGMGGVIAELQQKGLGGKEAGDLFTRVKETPVSPNLEQTLKIYQEMGYPASSLVFDPTLVRGLDYYTGIIFEVVLAATPDASSLAGGGRWDKMIGNFTGIEMPAVGFAIGFDRTVDAFLEKNEEVFLTTNTDVLVTFNSPESADKAVKVLATLRSQGINSEIWLDLDTKLEKQLKYADLRGIKFAVIAGLTADETEDEVILKNLNARTQDNVKINELVQKVKG